MAALLAGATLLTTSCRCGKLRGNVDTTKDYYDDDEAPEYQVQVVNGVETKVPWAAVPEGARYFTELDPTTGKLRVRVPIVRSITTSLDAERRPVPTDKAFYFVFEEVGLNPKHHRNAIGGRGFAH
jgi:hypothetical protein